MTPNEAHEFNIDVAQREIDGRAALGEDMTGATICPRTYAIVKPQPARILNKSQAEAAYSAMVVLNNVGARVVAEWEQVYDTGYYPKRKEQFEVREQLDGSILVRILGVNGETYANQAAFATAYGLQQG